MENQAVLATYKAILRGNYLEWRSNTRVPVPPDRAVAVYVTVLDEPAAPDKHSKNQGQRMAAALEQLAQLHACAEITDPAAWEHEIRQDRPLPGREA